MNLFIGRLIFGTLFFIASVPVSAQRSATSNSRGGSVLEVTPAATSTAVTTTGGTRGLLPAFDSPSSVVSSQLYTNLTYGGLGIGRVPAASLDVLGQTIFRGGAVFSRSGDATTTAGKPSFQFQFQSSVYNSKNKGTLIPNFTLQSEPTGNNTATTGATLNFLYYSGVGSAPSETGLYFNGNGNIHFAPTQTFPITQGPAGPQGPVGPAGAIGPAGPQGPAGTLVLPYVGSGPGSYAFYLTNTGTTLGGGIFAQGASSTSQSDGGVGITGGGGGGSDGYEAKGGIGLLGLGGHAGGGQYATGGAGVKGVGADVLAGNTYTYGGDGADFYGGQGTTYGGYGVVAVGADGYNGAAGGNGIAAYVGANGVYAGEFFGNVNINGNIYKSGGAFKIDHPVDPENKFLSHSFVESPDMKNIYDGNAVTDGSGRAIVELPDYFEALNRDFRYQLTTIGRPAKVWIADKVANNRFVIQTDEPGVEVSWQVTGIRQDAWANAHRIPNEKDKEPEEKGHYLHPELFGHPEDASIGAGRHSKLLTQQQ